MSLYAYLYGELRHWTGGGGIIPARLRLAALTLFWGSALYRWYFRWRHDRRRGTRHYSASQPLYPARTRDRRAWQDDRAEQWTPAMQRQRIHLRQGYLSRKYNS